jgi:glutathione reductase (NADPH)
MKEARIAADNIIHGLQSERPDYSQVPSVVFSFPRLASVGMHEAEAERKNLAFRVNEKDTSHWLHNERAGERFAGSRVLVEEGTERILGAHILDGHADDLINIFALAMQNGLTTHQVKETIYAYPSATSSIQYMVE